MAKAKPPETVTITYDLFELPTAQHRAGLAGLLLQIDSMKNRKKVAPTYKWDEHEPTTKVHFEFTEETISELFDDLYDATWVEGPPRKKPYFKGKGNSKKEVPAVRRTPITEMDKKGNEKVIEGYVYLELTPALATLRQYLPKDGEWVRLWRDLIWQVIRDSKKKAPYIQRAAAKARPEGVVIEDGTEADSGEDDEKGKADGSTWADIVKHAAARRKNTFAVGHLSSALLLSAQSKGAEALPFLGRIDQNLLLHFWPLTSMVYVPRFVDRDGNSHIGRRDKEDKSKHFCLAVPDIADASRFLEEYPSLLAGLGTEVAIYRPKEALIDLPAEGGISFVEHLARLTPQVATMAETRRSVSGIEYLHLNQDGNIVRTLSAGRVAYSRHLAEDYLAIATRYFNPLFRRCLMLALLDGKPWFKPFGKLFVEWDVSLFVPTEHPPSLSWFWADARKKIQEFIMSADPGSDTDPVTNERLVAFIQRIVERFLLSKAKKKQNIDPKTKLATLPPELRKKIYEEKRKVALDAFYRARSLHVQEFIAFFAEEICSFGSYFDPKAKEFRPFAGALIDPARTDDIKTLTLLTLSASA
jgi:CRISPR-associated protein Cmx8